MATKRLTIKTTADAHAYLKTQGIELGADKIWKSTACSRCGGSGYGPWRQDGGVCYACTGISSKGAGYWQSVEDFARGVRKQELAANKRREKAAAKELARLEKQRDWCEANTKYGRVTFDEKAELIRKEREAEPKSPVPSGTHEVVGTVIKVKESVSAYGTTWRMTVKCDGYLVNGTLPQSLQDEYSNAGDYSNGIDGWMKGRRVSFKATLEPSGRDESFGFFKRPRKAALLSEEKTAA